MNAFLATITVTGADSSIIPAQLLYIAKQYPYVEFGLLLSRNSMGCPRFPSADWLRNAVDVLSGRARCSGHLCGAWVREILLGQWPKQEFQKIHTNLLGLFRRLQLNTHGVPHDVNWPRFRDLLFELTHDGDEVIFQYDKVNTALIHRAFNTGFRVSALYDLSHGGGVLPERWENPDLACPIGYAGGLSPSNVADNLARIADVATGTLTWIDAETHLRFDSNRQFDISMVRQFLDAARTWVIDSPR